MNNLKTLYDKFNIPANAYVRYQTGEAGNIYSKGYFEELIANGKIEQAEKDFRYYLTDSKQIDLDGKWIGITQDSNAIIVKNKKQSRNPYIQDLKDTINGESEAFNVTDQIHKLLDELKLPRRGRIKEDPIYRSQGALPNTTLLIDCIYMNDLVGAKQMLKDLWEPFSEYKDKLDGERTAHFEYLNRANSNHRI